MRQVLDVEAAQKERIPGRPAEHERTHNKEKAEEYWKRTIPLWEELDDSKGLGNVYNNLGTQYHEIGKLEKASKYINKGLKYWMEIDFKLGINP